MVLGARVVSVFVMVAYGVYIQTAAPVVLQQPVSPSTSTLTTALSAHDHIQALEEVPRDEPSNALAPQVDGFLGTEHLRKKLAATEVQHFDTFANDMEEAIVALSKVLEHEGVPFPQSGRNLVDDRLRSAGQGIISRRESRTRGERLVVLRLGGGCRADRCGVDRQPCARRRRLVGKRGELG